MRLNARRINTDFIITFLSYRPANYLTNRKVGVCSLEFVVRSLGSDLTTDFELRIWDHKLIFPQLVTIPHTRGYPVCKPKTCISGLDSISDNALMVKVRDGDVDKLGLL